MKGKDIKQWVLNKRRSLCESRSATRQNSTDQPLALPPPPRDSMDVDAACQPNNASLPIKNTFYVKGTPFRVDPRYSFRKALGLGAYGVVCSADDAHTGRKVAVKKVSGVFDDLTDAKRIIREIRLMKSMNHTNILQIIDMDEPENYDTFNDVYIVSELMDTDMNKLLRSKNQLVDKHRKYFTYQICRALKYIHSASILHRDLKPANILVSATCEIKICDFGLARYMDPSEGERQNMTEYVVTRWYRAPELLLAQDEYSTAVDMWSIGCMVAELYSREPLFRGNDVKHQIECIFRLLGKPSMEEITSIRHPKARRFLEKISHAPRITLEQVMPNSPPDARDFVSKLLRFEPTKRLSADEALSHPYLAEFRDPASEITAHEITNEFLEPPKEETLGASGIRRLMWDEILTFRPSAKSREPPSAVLAKQNIHEAMN